VEPTQLGPKKRELVCLGTPAKTPIWFIKPIQHMASMQLIFPHLDKCHANYHII
jgi:hypothetical protein